MVTNPFSPALLAVRGARHYRSNQIEFPTILPLDFLLLRTSEVGKQRSEGGKFRVRGGLYQRSDLLHRWPRSRIVASDLKAGNVKLQSVCALCLHVVELPEGRQKSFAQGAEGVRVVDVQLKVLDNYLLDSSNSAHRRVKAKA